MTTTRTRTTVTPLPNGLLRIRTSCGLVALYRPSDQSWRTGVTEAHREAVWAWELGR